MSRLVLLSFDTEEFDIPREYGQAISEETQFRVSGEGFAAVLDLLDHLDVSATFFTTAAFALRHEEPVRRAAARHEIASHGYAHSSFTNDDLRRSKDALERVCGAPVVGFRRARLAPTDRGAIQAAGYRYNSSENPIWLPGRYNNLRAPRKPYFTGDLLNIPVSAVPLVRFPLFWLTLKNLPLWTVKAGSAATLASDSCLNLYYHPWEFTDLRPYRLPWYIKRRDGQRMLDRLADYLLWLKRRARFATFAEFDRLERERRGSGNVPQAAGG
jgi:peptidoglycan/xylan/chitin deacetylase (PgdA/CDA1 family)